jgi:DNA mismatch endonuclease (patch repair protein)
MSAIRAKNTKPEILLRKVLYKLGLIGYRLHWQEAPGRPDICYVSKKIAIFVHGCYWHRCPRCKLKLPKDHSAFWRTKFLKNVERDKEKVKVLKDNGWKTLILWECQVDNEMRTCIKKIMRLFKK